MLFKLTFYVPEANKEEVKEALFKAGAGKQGNYECCAFESKGQGQFRPLPGANPHVGGIGKLEFVEEYRVEILCVAEQKESVAAALKKAHPYETVAYDFVKVELS